jgi:tRNA U55 pseudouridine synthase TruB
MTADVLKILRWMVIGWAGALYLGTCLALCIAGCTKTLSFLPPTSKTYREPTRWKEPGVTGAKGATNFNTHTETLTEADAKSRGHWLRYTTNELHEIWVREEGETGAGGWSFRGYSKP